MGLDVGGKVGHNGETELHGPYPVLFTYEYAHSIDDKYRLAIPAEYRHQWNEQRDGKAWFCVPWPGTEAGKTGHLRLYTEATFQQMSSCRPAVMFPDEQEADREASYYGFAIRLTMDKQGRITIPEKHLRLAGLGRDVVIVGAGSRLEVRDRASWIATEEERFRRLPQRVGPQPPPSGAVPPAAGGT